MNLKKLFIASVCLAAGSAAALGAQVWHLVAEGGIRIPVSSIEYVLSHPGEGIMDVVLNDNATVYPAIANVTFEYAEEAGICAPAAPAECILGPLNGVFTLSGLPEGTTVRLYSSQGALMNSWSAPAGGMPLIVDVSGYAAGIYILRTANSTVKFTKR